MLSRVGYRIAAHCTALGRAILAELPDSSVDSILADKGMTRFTSGASGHRFSWH
ncbi:MAG TPA: hypothetical protein DCL63_08865 [Firmicutes bacterium]|nr:hypothetical protein [Bacillota bacterium]